MKKYVCGITFQHELGYTDEVSVYDTLEELKKEHPCFEECGVVEIDADDPDFWKQVDFEDGFNGYNSHKWVVDQNLSWESTKSADDATIAYVDSMRDEWDKKEDVVNLNPEAKKESDQ